MLPPHIDLHFRAPDELLHKKSAVIPQLYDWHAKENPNYPLFVYHDGDKLEYITYSTVNRAIERAARYTASILGEVAADGAGRKIVGVLASTGNAFHFIMEELRGTKEADWVCDTDTFTYYCTAIGIFTAGHTAFLISPRNSPAAVAAMLQKTGATRRVFHFAVRACELSLLASEELIWTIHTGGVWH